MEKCEQKQCETVDEPRKMDEAAEEKQDYTEVLHGVIVLRKGKLEEKDVWFGTVGNRLVSDGTYGTKKELIENLENMTLDRVCKIVAGAFARAINYMEEKA